MKIGELASRTGCEVETIRYYEREGMLPSPLRTGSNYRQYGEADVERLQFIRHCRSLGMSLDDVRILQRFQAQPQLACDEIDALLDRQLRQTQQQIESLQHLQKQLHILRNACRTQLSVQQCGILQNLQSAASGSECVCHHDV